MKHDSRRDQKSLKVFTGQQTKTARKTVAGHQKVAAIVAAAIEIDGCTLYRLDTWTTVDSVLG